MATNNFPLSCNSETLNTGLSKLCADLGVIVGYIVCPYNFAIDTANLAKTKATWTTAIQDDKGSRIYPFPPVFNMEDNSEDSVYDEGTVSSIFVRDGKINYKFIHESGRYKHKALKSHSQRNVSVYLIDQQGRIHGVSSDGVFFEAINIETFAVEKLKGTDGSEGTKSSVTMIFADSDKFQNKPAIVKPTDFSPAELEGLFDVVLAEYGTGSGSTKLVVSATIYGTEEPVYGLEQSDFVVTNSSGVSQTITGITEGDGVYTLNFTSLASAIYTVNLKSASQMTTSGYESLGGVAIDIS